MFTFFDPRYILVVFCLLLGMAVVAPDTNAARTSEVWVERLGSYLETTWAEGRDILINGSNKYLNFGSISGGSGYGFRDNGGDMQFKNSGGSWADFGGGGSGGGDLNEADIDTEAELEGVLTDVSNLFTNNDGALNDDDLSDNDTDDLSEGSNLYFTNGRAISALTGQNISIFTNNSGFITSPNDSVAGSELDGVFSTNGLLRRTGASTYSTITDASSNWNTAYGWGNHASAGYLTTVDVSSDTNLAVSSPITLSGDTVGINQGLLSITESQISDLGSYLTTVDVSSDTNLTAGRSLTLSGDSVVADAELYTDTFSLWFESPTADDDFKSIFENDFGKNLTIVEISCESDQTVNLDLQVDDGTPADVNGTDIACTSSGVDDTSFAGDSTISDNESVDLAITSVSGDPTWVRVSVTYTIAD